MDIKFSIEESDLIESRKLILKKPTKNKPVALIKNPTKLCIIAFIVLTLFLLIFFITCMYIILNKDTKDFILFLKSSYSRIILLSIISCSATFTLVFIPIHYIFKLFNSKFFLKTFRYLITNYSIKIEEDLMILDSREITIKIKLKEANIIMNNDFLVLLKEDKFLSIIPIYKIPQKDLLISNIKEYTEVIKYDL